MRCSRCSMTGWRRCGRCICNCIPGRNTSSPKNFIARKIHRQPPQSCNYADNKEVGTWLNNILKKGGTEDWRKVLKDATGEEISTRAMMDYFKPLMNWLEEQNKGRQIGWE